MFAKSFSKILTLYERQLCSPREAAKWLIDAAISDKEFDSGYISLLKSLPQPILNEITPLLGGLKAKGFHWEPGRIGSTLPVDSPERRERLQNIAIAMEPSDD